MNKTVRVYNYGQCNKISKQGSEHLFELVFWAKNRSQLRTLESDALFGIFMDLTFCFHVIMCLCNKCAMDLAFLNVTVYLYKQERRVNNKSMSQ
jgi:hypothetical protein